MKFLSIIFLFGGYTLIYSAVAKQGKFATEPWASLMADAYSPDTEPGASGQAAVQAFSQPPHGATPPDAGATATQAFSSGGGRSPISSALDAIKKYLHQ